VLRLALVLLLVTGDVRAAMAQNVCVAIAETMVPSIVSAGEAHAGLLKAAKIAEAFAYKDAGSLRTLLTAAMDAIEASRLAETMIRSHAANRCQGDHAQFLGEVSEVRQTGFYWLAMAKAKAESLANLPR
jgi:hypothetical protein